MNGTRASALPPPRRIGIWRRPTTSPNPGAAQTDRRWPRTPGGVLFPVSGLNFRPTATVSGGCLLTDSTHQLSLGGIGATVGTGEADPLTVTGVATLASPTTVVLQCNGPGMYVSGGRIIATKIGALH
jgi:hypothetical protein